uniref:Endothelin-converting protein 5 n=1 Tax=Tityus serrulatus TaxID=6887 RepID=A0A1S5QN34_TITSE|nr:endothelin-converting protein 5 [Tityus serrulatus]
MENSKSEKKICEEKKCTLWTNRTLLERYLSLVCLLFFIAFLVMVGVLLHFQNISRRPKKEICLSNICKHSAGSILTNIDFTINPCDNFYEFSCGSYLKYTNIYDDKIRRFIDLVNYVIYLGKVQLEKPDKLNDPAFVKKVKKYYRSCLNKPNDVNEIIQGIINTINLDGWPLSENENSRSTLEEAVVLAYVYQNHPLLFNMYTAENNSYININSGSTTVRPTVLLNTTEEKWIKFKEKYLDMINYVFSKLDLSTETMNRYVNEMIDFETALAKIQDITREDNSTNSTISELQSLCPQIEWKNLFKFLFEYLHHPEEYSDEFPLKISSMDYFNDLCELIGNTKNKRVIYNLQVWNIIVPYLALIDNYFRQFIIDMKGAIYIYKIYFQELPGMNKLKWKSCIHDMEFYMGLAFNYIMIKSTNRKEDINEVKSFARQISEELGEIFSEEDWIDSYSKNITKFKLENMKYQVGYENGSINEEFLDRIVANINITDNYIENLFSVQRQVSSDNMFDPSIILFFREEIKMNPMEVGASFGMDPAGGIIELPLGLMYPPFYSFGLPKYLNFGGVAVVIGHEYSHGFDHLDYEHERSKKMENSTDEYDKKLPKIIFPEEFLEEYKKKKNCLRFQYSEFPLEGNLTIDGNQTIADNIADNSGLKVAFRVYEKYLKHHGEEPYLPGLDFTNKQMFFIGYAQLWCEVIESMKNTFEDDGHSPGKYRVLVPLMNLPEFSEVFNCPLKSYMNPVHKCKLWG